MRLTNSQRLLIDLFFRSKRLASSYNNEIYIIRANTYTRFNTQ